MAYRMDTGFFLPLDPGGEAVRTDRGAEIVMNDERVRIEFIRADVVRVKISQNGEFDLRPTDAVVSDDFGPVSFALECDGKQAVLTTDALRVVADLSPFSLDVFRTDGRQVLKSVAGRAYSHLNGHWCVARGKAEDDGIFGLGQKTGTLNRNGRSFAMWNLDALQGLVLDDALDPHSDPYYISIPFFYHVTPDGAAAGSFIDNGYRLRYDFTAPDSYTVVGEGGQFTEYIFSGPSLPDILGRYTELTGRMQPPPLWALGHHQCRWQDYHDSDVRRIADIYREKNIPCDVLWLDIDYMDGYRIFTWEPEKFPDPAALTADMEKQGFRMVTIIDPGVKLDPEYAVYTEGKERRLFCAAPGGTEFVGEAWPGHTVFPDFSNEETRAWWADHIARHVSCGLSGVWLDMNEPSFMKVDQRRMLFSHGRDEHQRWHNQYGFLMARSTREGLEKKHPGLRQFILCRAGFAGIQRYSANWMGDNLSRWDYLALSVPMCNGLGISGQPFVGSDIGGFANDTTEELLVRWYQYAVFQPFCRNHTIEESRDQYPWSFGAKAENRIRRSVELRYRLLPAIYTAFMRSAETGEPIQRPLVYDFQNDTKTWEIDDQFLFGEHILVAPVLDQGVRKRRVYLPAGGWYPLDTPGYREGGRMVTVPAPIDECPVFVRAGAVIPTAEVVQTTAEYAPETIILDVYLPVEDGEWISLLHEDDGLTCRHADGEFLRTEFRVARENGRVTLSGKTTGGGFPGFRRKEFRVRVIGETITESVVPNAGKDFSIEIGV